MSQGTQVGTTTSYAHKVLIEILVFIMCTFIVETVFFGQASMVGWEIQPYFKGIIILEQFAWFTQAILWFGTMFINMITFNIPGLPVEIRTIIAPAYIFLILIELIVFWREIYSMLRIVWDFLQETINMLNPFKYFWGQT